MYADNLGHIVIKTRMTGNDADEFQRGPTVSLFIYFKKKEEERNPPQLCLTCLPNLGVHYFLKKVIAFA